jgi:tRNA modification GTPase
VPTGTTITAISSASGNAPRALLRISGPETRAIAQDLFAVNIAQRGAQHARLSIGPVSLPVILMFFAGPRSYTGEDTLELLMCGGAHAVARVLERILDDDRVSLAQPGEFSARAYMNGHLSLAEAEGIALRISAQNEDALRASDTLLDGRYGIRCNAWVDEIAGLLALVEAGVDFSDQEDVVPIAPCELDRRLRATHAEILGQSGSQAGSAVVDDRPSVVLVGRPNAGKSALFNALLGRHRAVVSEHAGTTRDALRETLDLSAEIPGASTIELVDLAGLDEQGVDAVDQEAQRLARAVITQADAVLWCDPGGWFDQQGFELRGDTPVVRVRTKSDLPTQGACDHSALAVCAFDPATLGVLRRAIADATTQSGGAGIGAYVPRHRRALNEAARGITDALARLDPSEGSLAQPELIALGLREALDALGELVGEVSPDDVIGRVFATFCVGK